MTAKNPVLHSIQHLLLGAVLVLKGIDKIPHHHILGGLILSFGIVVLLYFLYMVLKQKESRTMHILIHLFEAFASLFTAYIFFEEGKKYLQYALILAAIGFFVSVYVYMRNHKEKGACQTLIFN